MSEVQPPISPVQDSQELQGGNTVPDLQVIHAGAEQLSDNTGNGGQTAIEQEKTFLELMQDLQLEDYKQDIKARGKYADKLFSLIAWWLVAMLVIVMLTGFKGWSFNFSSFRLVASFALSDTVILALIGSTTTTVIGLFLVVVNYLFPQRKPPA